MPGEIILTGLVGGGFFFLKVCICGLALGSCFFFCFLFSIFLLPFWGFGLVFCLVMAIASWLKAETQTVDVRLDRAFGV